MRTLSFASPVFALALVAQTVAAPLPIATIQRETPVDFAAEVFPALRKNCLACHNQTKAKAGLVLESPETILKGGDSGPSVVAGKSAESLLFLTSAHLEDPVMPPAGNASRAVNLTPEQLALLKLWIDQGAKGSSSSMASAPSHWETIRRPAIYAVAISPDNRFIACGRGQTIQIYDLPARKLCAELSDPDASGKSHLDVVQSLAFGPDGTLASGGFREVKLWRRPAWVPVAVTPGKPAGTPPVLETKSADGTRLVRLESGKAPALVDSATGKILAELNTRPEIDRQLDDLGREEAMAKRLAALHLAAIPKLQEAVKKEEDAANQAATALPAARATLSLRAREMESLRGEEQRLSAEARLLAEASPERKAADGRLAALRTKISAAEAQQAEAVRAVELTVRNRETGARLSGEGLARLTLERSRHAEAEAALKSFAERRKELEAQKGKPDPASVPGAAVFNPDGTTLAVGLAGGVIHLYLAKDGRHLESFVSPPGLIALSSDSAGLHSTHRELGTFTWRLEKPWQLAGRIGDGKSADLLKDRVSALAFASGGKQLITGTGEPSRSGIVQLWQIDTGKEVARNDKAHRDTITAIALAPDDSRFVTSSTDGLAKIFRADSVEPVRSLEGHTGQVLDVDWSHDGRTIVSAGADLQTKFWNAETGEIIRSVTGWSREVTSADFLTPATEQVIAVSGDRSVKLDAAVIGQGTEFLHVAVASQDGKWLVTGDEAGNLQVWAMGLNKLEVAFPPPQAGLTAAASSR